MNKKLLLFFSLAFSLISSSSVFAEEIIEKDEHPFMLFTSKEIIENYNNLLNTGYSGLSNEDEIFLPKQNYSLEPYMHVIDETWDQASCGSCWVWGATLATEIAYSYHIKQPSRFSVQYFMSNYCNGGYVDNYEYAKCKFACGGGLPYIFSDFYQSKQAFIPWDNIGASDYKDRNGGKTVTSNLNEYQVSNVLPSEISETPAVHFNSITPRLINTYDVSETTAIENIKKELLAGNAVMLGFYMPTTSDLTKFKVFWRNDDETALFDFKSFANKTVEHGKNWDSDVSGHETTIIGFNDTDPDPSKHYWLVQNSWGVPTNRPKGTFRFPMHMNYGITSYLKESNFYFPILTFEVFDIDFSQPQSLVYGTFKTSNLKSLPYINVTLNDSETKTSSADGSFTFSNVKKYSNFTLTYSRQGYLFNPANYQGFANQDIQEVQINISKDSAYDSCLEVNTSKPTIVNHLLKIRQIGLDLYETTQDVANKKSESKKAKIKQKALAIKEDLDEHITKLHDAFNNIPDFVYECKHSDNCNTYSHKQYNRRLRAELLEIENIYKRSVNLIVKYAPQKENYGQKRLNQSHKAVKSIRQILSHVPSENMFCE